MRTALNFAKRCPKCRCTRLAQSCVTWVDTEKGEPVAFDQSDAKYAEAAPDNALDTGVTAICRDCGHSWEVVK